MFYCMYFVLSWKPFFLCTSAFLVAGCRKRAFCIGCESVWSLHEGSLLNRTENKKNKKRHLCVLSAHAHHNVTVQRTRNTHLGEGGALSLAPFLNRPPHVRVAMAAFDRRFAFLVAERIGGGRTERRGAAQLAHGTDARRLSFSIRSDRLFPQCICVGGHKIVLIIVAHTSKR